MPLIGIYGKLGSYMTCLTLHFILESNKKYKRKT